MSTETIITEPKDNPFLPPKEDAITESNRKQKELQADCAKMRVANEYERKEAPADRFEFAQHSRNLHRYVLPEGDSLQNCLETDYWVHILPKLTVLDRIEINPDDGSFYAELIVRSLAFGQVVTAIVNHVKFSDVPNPSPELVPNLYDVGYKGPHEKWCVTSPKGEILMRQLDTESVARGWLADLLKASR